MDRLGSLLVNVPLALFAVLLTVGAFEVVVRFALPEWAPAAGDRRFWRYDAQLGWSHRPNQEGMHRHADFQVRVAINEHGMRDAPAQVEREPARPRMLFLGDSFGWGFGVERHEGVVELLEQSEPARADDWEILNASVSGYGTDQQLLWYQTEGRQFQPDVVFLLLHPNDFLDNHQPSRYGYAKPAFELAGEGLELGNVPVPQKRRRRQVERWVYNNVALYPHLVALPDLISEAALPWFQPVEEVAVPARTGRAKWHLADEHLEITYRLLGALKAEVEADGARLVVGSVRMVPHLRRFLAETLEELDVPHQPLGDTFRGFPREQHHFQSDPHWNAAGHRLAADTFEAFLCEVGVFGAPPVAESRI